MAKETITSRIYKIIFDVLEKNPDGIRWVDLNKVAEEKDPSLHPKSINGCVWKLLEKYPDDVYKPSKGVFMLKKFK